MTTIAPKLPYTHPFAGGYPRLGGQPLPTDPDAIDYLNRVAAADGAAVEVGVAMAIDAFVKGCKADGTWAALKASCILCGARTISGALVPLVGAAPTPYNFASGDYSRTTGLKGDGSTKYLNSNLANNAMPQDSIHIAGFISSASSVSSAVFFTSYGGTPTGLFVSAGNDFEFYLNSLRLSTGISAATGFFGASRSAATTSVQRVSAADTVSSVVSGTPKADSIRVFNDATESATYASDARLAFYSIGSSLDLAALDNRVSTLVAAIAAAI